MLKRTLALLLASALAAPAALAQPFPQPGVISGYSTKQTFRAVSIALGLASTPTDFFCIAGSATKTIRLTRLDVSGTITTAINLPLVLLRRVALDTGGTAALATANPANTIGKADTTFATPSATLIAYTGNPTINDSSPTYLGAYFLPLQPATGTSNWVDLTFGDHDISLMTPPTIRNGQTTQQLCLNGQSSSATLTGNSLNITVEWTEE